MQLHDLRPDEGAKKKRKRLGIGVGSGHGKTAGRGTKGQGARSGGGVRPWFEGGQLPLVRRLPFKRGFKNRNRVEYAEINLERLEKFEAGTEVTLQAMVDSGLLRNLEKPVVILGRGDLSYALTVHAHRFSEGARRKIEGAGGQAVVEAPLEGTGPREG